MIHSLNGSSQRRASETGSDSRWSTTVPYQMRIIIFYNLEQELHGGEITDSVAITAVQGAAAAIERACMECGWEVKRCCAPEDPMAFLSLLGSTQPDVIFNLVESLKGDARLETGAIWLYELAGLPYTGSPPRATMLALEKPVTRALLSVHGVPIPAGQLFETGDEPIDGLRPPWIVKPAREDASHGITLESVVHNEISLRERIRYIYERYQQAALVEEFISGREFNVSILGEGADAAALSLAEIDYTNFPPGPRLITYNAKWMDDSPECTGSVPVAATNLSDELRTRITEVALAAYRVIGLRDYGRIDLRLRPEGGPVVLDVNANPDLSPDAGLARAAARSGIDYVSLIRRIVTRALERAR
jgi:D-alanine-D-alanine ligase